MSAAPYIEKYQLSLIYQSLASYISVYQFSLSNLRFSANELIACFAAEAFSDFVMYVGDTITKILPLPHPASVSHSFTKIKIIQNSIPPRMLVLSFLNFFPIPRLLTSCYIFCLKQPYMAVATLLFLLLIQQNNIYVYKCQFLWNKLHPAVYCMFQCSLMQNPLYLSSSTHSPSRSLALRQNPLSY